MKHQSKARILVVWAGRHRRSVWTELCERYGRRIRRHVGIEEIAVKVAARAADQARCEIEGRAILEKVPTGSCLVALDSRGRQRTSEELARWLGRVLEGSRRPLVFALGSDLGLGENVTAAADERISFGAVTLPHELARVVLFEQIYRTLCILKGMKYHREPL